MKLLNQLTTFSGLVVVHMMSFSGMKKLLLCSWCHFNLHSGQLILGTYDSHEKSEFLRQLFLHTRLRRRKDSRKMLINV